MNISVTFNSTHHVLLASQFFLARRPVMDRRQDLVAHEILFCAPQTGANALTPDALPASVPVIADVCEHGLSRVIGDLRGILYIDAAALMSDIFDSLPADRLIFELSAAEELAPDVLARLQERVRSGFHFALVAERGSRAAHQLLPFVEGVRVDASGPLDAEIMALCHTFKAAGKRLLAEHVDTPLVFQRCLDLGFDFFQGYFFTVPTMQPGRTLTASQLAISELMGMIDSDADSAEIEHRLKTDVTLGLKLLRMANVPAFGGHRIDSLRQALMVLGRNQLQRWLQLMLYADAATEGRAVLPLLALAANRGRLVELLAQKLRPGNRGIADTGFTVGIMSLMDTLFSMPMEDILEQMPVVDEVADALLVREGYLGKLLSLAVYAEWANKNDVQLQLLLQDLKLSFQDLYALQLAAFEWSDEVARHARLG